MASFYEELQRKDLVDDKENSESRVNVDKWIFRLFLILIGFTPIVVLANVEEVISPLISNMDMLASGMKGDMFTHYKLIMLIILTVIIIMMFLAKIYFMGGTFRKTYLNYVFGAFILAIVLSTIMSPNILIALNGQYNRSDGAISWLCYVILMFIATNIEYPKNVIRYILFTMMPFVYINLVIITLNFYGKDLLQQVWAQKLVSFALPEGAMISEGSEIIGTLNQWNYMSGMFAIMTVMYLIWALLSENWIETIAGAVTASAAIAVMFMSISTSGFLTVVVLIPVIIVAVFRKGIKIYSVVGIVLFLLISIPVFNILDEKSKYVWDESFGFFINKESTAVENAMLFNMDNTAYASDKVLELPVLPASSVSLGTGRLYIWEKTLDLVEDRILFGYGMDTLMYNFPHYNIDARAGLMTETTIVDKPHNGFLGILYGFGIVAFIAIVIIFFTVLKMLFKSLYLKSWDIFLLAMVCLAYFIQTIFNDSLPGMSTVIFVLLGILIRIFYNQSVESVKNERIN
ncbi:MAG: O-antigen ligase family protein [Solibacillus sp.]